VTLSGTVRSEAERTKAVQMAKDTAGVTQVVDRLAVR
jgi:osmotically-inducible protein OsmY